MAEFFHVSRTDISFLEEFKLFPHEGGINATSLHIAEEFNNLKSYLYPNGISSHGQNYLQRPYQSCGPNNAFCPNKLVIETTFELIRQLNFPQKKSRF
ncbi:hypothetical protein LZZ98_11655 [Acinetobacter sp. SM34]|uniref:hypothetical protein n=1 Tax=Acinetobacter sp. SM34 TaxID=1301620 RepID=UPI001EDBCED2|nr:hypothetical protein [Acinetobacter sp. SM34]MCG2609167.1 hypothetical protein [Acinetobacter sp. SM34]